MNAYIEPDDERYSQRARELVRIGREAIARPDDEALDRYFSRDYVLHAPTGSVDLAGLKAFFGSMRRAFAGFACERLAIVEQDNLVAARTVMTGIFNAPLEGTAWGPIQPNGQPMRRELMNLFRYDETGRVAEEWAQYDDATFLAQLGIKLMPHSKGV